MKESVVIKLENLVERFAEVQALLGDPDTISNQEKFRALSKEFSQLEDVVAGFNAYRQAEEDLASAQEMLQEDDAEMREMAQAWSPWRSVAARLLWAYYRVEKQREGIR